MGDFPVVIVDPTTEMVKKLRVFTYTHLFMYENDSFTEESLRPSYKRVQSFTRGTEAVALRITDVTKN